MPCGVRNFINFECLHHLSQMKDMRDLKEARTATVGNKQLNFSVKTKP